MNVAKFLSQDELREFEVAQSDRLQETARSLQVDDDKLEIVGTKLKFKSIVEEYHYESEKDLAEIWVPGSGGFEHPVPLLLYPHHAQTVIRRIDLFAQGVKHTPSFTQNGAPAVFANTIKFIEWGLLNDHYLLESISKRDIKKLHQELKYGGVPQMLQIPQRLDAYWHSIKDDVEAIQHIVHIDEAVQALNANRLTKLIGASSIQGVVPKYLYQQIAYKLRESGFKVRDRFASAGVGAPSQPKEKTLSTLFSQWNELARLDEGDHLSILPFPNVRKLSLDLGKPSARTRNLHAVQVVQLLGTAHLWMHKASPLIIQVIRDLKATINTKFSLRTIRETFYSPVLESSPALDELEQITGITVYRGSPNLSTNAEDGVWTLVDCITALMSACFVVLQTYNARREAEIQDPVIGITKPEHFRCVDKEHGWYQAYFFNAKHGERYWYTLNRGSTKALQVLFDLKDAWNTTETTGLFNVPSFTLDHDYNVKAYKFSYNKGKYSRVSGNKFLQLVFGDNADSAKGSHIFRRIYAIIYHYQYENRELLALSHQLGHVDPDVTEIYVTEPVAREQHEQLQYKVKLTNDEKTESTRLIKEESKALEMIIAEVDVEKTSEDILALLMGSISMAGRFPAYLKRVFKVLSKSVKFNKHIKKRHHAEFADLLPEQQSEEMAKLVYKRGHRNHPKPHNTCHQAYNTPRSHNDPCDPVACKGCAFQDVKQTHMDIMSADLIELREIAGNEFDYNPLERIRAEEAAENLARVVAQHKRTMASNVSLFSAS